MRKNIFLSLTILILFSACKKKTASVDLKTDYFPLKVGAWIIYDVDSTYYDDFLLKHYTHHFQLKELVASSFIDGSGDVAYRLERYERNEDTLPFQIRNVWTEKIINNRAEKVEENQRFVKMIFPPTTSGSWKGNIYIKPDLLSIYTKFLGDWDYNYSSVDLPQTIGGKYFNATATVIAYDEFVPGLQKTNFTETYAKGVGLVYFHHQYVEKQPSDTTWVAGFNVTATVNSYGN